MRGLLTCLFLLISFTIYAEGSRDLYPTDVKGIRAFLVSGRSHFAGRIERGTHYVWAQQGETIAVASSAQNLGNGRITVISPSGTVYETKADNIGRIYANNGRNTREAELAGPGIGYIPYEIDVTEEGIWEILFSAPYDSQSDESDIVNAGARWEQQLNAFIAAWDISVRPTSNPKNWIKGRVFTHTLYMYINSKTMGYSDGSGGYYGTNFVLTNDGFLYKVDANGNHGLGFLYFANNKGFSDNNGAPSYKSINQDKTNFHPPYLPDTENLITHKLFYNVPDPALPKQSSGRYPGNNTWLLKQPEPIEVRDISIIGYESNENYVSKRGSWIEFEASYAGRYQVEVKSASSLHNFLSRTFIHEANIGSNKIYWDGRDADGKLIPEGNYPIEVNIGLLEGEVHFPYLDVELNPNGLLIERFDLAGNNLGYVNVYWDDSNITPKTTYGQSNPLTNLTGILSNINGHKWGLYDQVNGRLSYFGDMKGMDTWTYQVDVKFTKQKNITVKVHDLSIAAISADNDAVRLDENYSYTVIVKNDGPSDAINVPFTFEAPFGVSIQSFQTLNSCGTPKYNNLNDNLFTSILDVAKGCELIFTFNVKVDTPIEEFYTAIPVQASIVRAPDTTDPDATSQDMDKVHPGEATEECQTQCNNILWNHDVILLDPLEQNARIGLKKSVTYNDTDKSETVSVGDNLTYHFEIKNLGDVLLKNISVIDDFLADEPIWNTFELYPQETLNFHYNYVMTDKDLHKKIYNSAIVSGFTPRNRLVKDISGIDFDNDIPTVFSSLDIPKILLKKVVDNIGTGEHGQFTLGDVIRYHFEIKHEGDEAVRDAKLIDRLISEEDITIDALIVNGTLSHFEDFIIDEEALQIGKIINSATVTATTTNYGFIVKDISGNTFNDDSPTETPLARPYITQDDYFDVYEGKKITFDFIKNDIIGTSTVKEVTFLDDFKYGSIAKTNNGYQYTPFANIKDVVETVRYLIYDNSRLKSNISTLLINIQKTQAIAVDDSFKTSYNFARNLDISENDYSKGSKINRSSVVITTPAKNGTLSIHANGTVEYIPNHLFTGTDFFEYQISDVNGNFSEPAKVIIEVIGVYIPNVITPNHDNINDIFFIVGANLYDKVELQVRDRFGVEVFSNTDYKNDWMPAEHISEGTYFYILKFYKGSRKPSVQKGHLLIMRSWHEK